MKRHSFDPISLLFGLTFAIIGLVFLLGDVDIIDLGWHWLWPVPLIFLGTLILLLLIKSIRERAVEPVETLVAEDQSEPRIEANS